ncbi:MAG: DNA-processing protein DprA [Alphaproteobacteria bacterium]|nr:DNA-processing protein DprA [Alphaproteobacteria bacterium]
MALALMHDGLAVEAISPLRELGAYEALWLDPKSSFKTIAERFARNVSALPSDFVSRSEADSCAHQVLAKLKAAGVHRFGVRINHAGDYPMKLRDAEHPIELLYFQGEWELTESRCVAVVGSRKASDDGKRRARRIARALVGETAKTGSLGFTVVSGLAEGIDRAAHEAALEAGGRTIAVIGTPLGSYYPKENRELQDRIANDFLLISQVPVLRYETQDWRINRGFFPERNRTMSALTEATIIVEAEATSGTLTQARAAVHQKRKLFILDSCFARKDIDWSAKYEAQGAIRVRSMNDVWDNLD